MEITKKYTIDQYCNLLTRPIIQWIVLNDLASIVAEYVIPSQVHTANFYHDFSMIQPVLSCTHRSNNHQQPGQIHCQCSELREWLDDVKSVTQFKTIQFIETARGFWKRSDLSNSLYFDWESFAEEFRDLFKMDDVKMGIRPVEGCEYFLCIQSDWILGSTQGASQAPQVLSKTINLYPYNIYLHGIPQVVAIHETPYGPVPELAFEKIPYKFHYEDVSV